MAGKTYKQLYEESIVKQVTSEELQALKTVAYGCNTNTALRGQNEYTDALLKVFALIERLSQ